MMPTVEPQENPERTLPPDGIRQRQPAPTRRKPALVLIGILGFLPICALIPIFVIAAALLLNATSSPMLNLAIAPAPESRPELKTAAGTMAISGLELGQRFPPGCSSGPTCQSAKEGYQVLILWLERKDGGSIDEVSGQLFDETIPLLAGEKDKESGYVTSHEGYKAQLAMVQTVGSRFALVFAVPTDATDFTLTWPNNPPVRLGTPQAGLPVLPMTPISINSPPQPPATPSALIPSPTAASASAFGPTPLPTRVRLPASSRIAGVVNRGKVGLAILGWGPALPPAGSKPDAGKKLIVVDLVVINRDGKYLRPSFNLFLRDSSGQQWARDNMFYYPQGTGQPFQHGLVPGERQRGQILFQVPQDRNGFSLIYDPRDSSDPIVVPLPAEPIAYTPPMELLAPHPGTRKIGDVIKSGNVGLSVLSWEIVPVDLSRSYRPDTQFVVVEAVVVNLGKEPLLDSGYRMFLKDNTGEQYNTDVLPLPRRCGGVDALDRGLAPGERVRGKTAFLVEKDATDLVLAYDELWPPDGERIFVALGNKPTNVGEPKDLPSDNPAKTYTIGEGVPVGTLLVTVTGITLSAADGMKQPPQAGNKYVVVDLTVKNTGSERIRVDEGRDMNLRDGKDQYYACRFGGVPVTDLNQASWQNEIAPGEVRRGQVGYEVPVDSQKLFFVVRAGQYKERIFVSLLP